MHAGGVKNPKSYQIPIFFRLLTFEEEQELSTKEITWPGEGLDWP